MVLGLSEKQGEQHIYVCVCVCVIISTISERSSAHNTKWLPGLLCKSENALVLNPLENLRVESYHGI